MDFRTWCRSLSRDQRTARTARTVKTAREACRSSPPTGHMSTGCSRRWGLLDTPRRSSSIPASGKKPRAWASDRFRQLAERLVERHPGKTVLVHDHHPFDRPDGWPSSDSIRTVSGTSLVELTAVIERCSLYVGNDSGPMHIAAALGVPTVGIYGPSSPEQTSPRGVQGVTHLPVSASFACSPCRERFFEECPSPPSADERPPCLNDVDVEMVADAVDRVLGSRS